MVTNFVTKSGLKLENENDWLPWSHGITCQLHAVFFILKWWVDHLFERRQGYGKWNSDQMNAKQQRTGYDNMPTSMDSDYTLPCMGVVLITAEGLRHKSGFEISVTLSLYMYLYFNCWIECYSLTEKSVWTKCIILSPNKIFSGLLRIAEHSEFKAHCSQLGFLNARTYWLNVKMFCYHYL